MLKLRVSLIISKLLHIYCLVVIWMSNSEYRLSSYSSFWRTMSSALIRILLALLLLTLILQRSGRIIIIPSFLCLYCEMKKNLIRVQMHGTSMDMKKLNKNILFCLHFNAAYFVPCDIYAFHFMLLIIHVFVLLVGVLWIDGQFEVEL